MSILEMERRAKDWLGVHSVNTRNVPPYGSDLNLWPPIYTELAKRGLLDEWLSALDANTPCWPDSIQPIESLTWRNAILIAATAEDRLRALVAVLDSLRVPA